MSGRLEGKCAIVTGAAQGIGRETSIAFTREGARVVACDINEDRLSELDKYDAIRTVALDATNPGAVSALGLSLTALDIVFNCAGCVHHGTIEDCTSEQWSNSFNVNVTSAYLMIKTFLPHLSQSNGGSIVNMSSVVSSISAAPNRFAYSTMKSAIIGLTKSIARDYVDHGIRCNAICPATVDTPSWEDRVNASDDPAQARRDFIARQPMGRVGTAGEIASAAIYLASDESAYTTGSVLVVDGGMSL